MSTYEPPSPLRKCIVKFRFHSFNSEIKDQLILDQQLYKKLCCLNSFSHSYKLMVAPWGASVSMRGAEFWKKLLDGRYSPMLLPLWETLSRQKFSFSIVANVSISYSRYKSIVKYFLQWNQMMANFRNCSHKQWCIQWLSNPSTPVWVPKLAA